MRKMLTLVLLLSFACSEETEFQCESCINMTISDALPIQFWRNGCPTYNEKESCGVHSFCWNQKFDCDDEIRLQVTDSEYSDGMAVQLLDENGDLLIELPFEVDNPDKTEFFDTSDLAAAPTYNTPFNGSINWSSSQVTLTYPGGPPMNTLAYSKRIPVDIPAGIVNVVLELNLTLVSGTPTSTLMWVRLLDADLNVVGFTNVNTGTTTQALYPDLNITASADVAYIDLQPRLTAVSAAIFRTLVDSMTLNWTVDSDINTYDLVFTPSDLSPEICDQKVQLQIVDNNQSPAEIAKSDYVEFSNNLECTQVFKYRNQRNFAGINYADLVTDTSPAEDEYFYIRIPAVFFHERQQGESEALELSNSKYISINGVLRQQKLLELDYMPYYMHKKIQLILMHQYLEDVETSTRWTKQENYEVPEGNKRYPLKMAKVWLTERDFVARNVV